MVESLPVSCPYCGSNNLVMIIGKPVKGKLRETRMAMKCGECKNNITVQVGQEDREDEPQPEPTYVPIGPAIPYKLDKNMFYTFYYATSTTDTTDPNIESVRK